MSTFCVISIHTKYCRSTVIVMMWFVLRSPLDPKIILGLLWDYIERLRNVCHDRPCVWSLECGVMLVLDFYRSHHTCSESVCRPELCKLPYAANILFTQYTTHQYQYLVIMSCGHSTQTCGEFEISFKFWISNKVVWVHRRYNIECLPVCPAYIISIIYVETKWWWHMSCNVCYSVTHDLCNV